MSGAALLSVKKRRDMRSAAMMMRARHCARCYYARVSRYAAADDYATPYGMLTPLKIRRFCQIAAADAFHAGEQALYAARRCC